MTSIHPAVFSDNLLEPMAEMIGWHDGGVLFDPCAGLGWKLGQIAERCGMLPLGVDIEADLYRRDSAPWVGQRDSTDLRSWYDAASWRGCDAACTSFVYPNGMADNFHAKDNSKRHTYVHYLRAALNDPTIELQPNNMAGMQPRGSAKALARFMDTQQKIITEVFKVLIPGAPFVVNTKDPPYNGTYTHDTHQQLLAAGFEIIEFRELPAAGLNHGANQDGKAENENLTLARRPA